MSNIISSFSVPAESKAAKRLIQWKEEGVILSHRVQEWLDEDTTPIEQQLEALHAKLWYAAFALYYPRGRFAKPMQEAQVLDILGFKYTKAATKKEAGRRGW